MIPLGRTDTSVIGRWWWTVDRWSLAALALIIVIGVMLTMAASPAVAERIGADHFHFIRRQFIFLPPALLVILGVSLLSPKDVRRLACLGFLCAIALMGLTLVAGQEIKGATRWVNLGPLSVQPSEFVKPTFAVVAAWMFSEQRLQENFPGDRKSVV